MEKNLKLNIVSNSKLEVYQNIYHINIQGLPSHFDQLLYFVERKMPLILCITETHITEDIEDIELNIDNYCMLRCNSNSRHTGGVIAYIHDTLPKRKVTCVSVPFHYWYIHIQTKINGKVYDIGMCYKSPNSSNKLEDFLIFFDKQCEELWEYQNKILILGDFNIDCADNNKSKTFRELLNNYGLKQMITEYTHVTSKSKTLIDLIITNDHDMDTYIQKTPKISDHYWTVAVVNECLERTSIMLKKITKIDHLKLCRELSGCNWFYDEENIDKLLDIFYKNFNDCINLVKEERSFSVRNKCPWINRDATTKMRARDNQYRKFLLTQTETDWLEYKKLRNLCVFAIRKGKKEYFHQQIDSNKHNSKRMWRTLKLLVNGSKKSEIKQMRFDDKLESDEAVIASKLNQYYVSSVEEIVRSIASGDEATCPLPTAVITRLFSEFDNLSLNHLRRKIYEVKSNNNSKEILNKNVLKSCFDVFGFPLLNFVNMSLKTGKFPQKLKCSVITPVPKVKNTRSCMEMRPINVLIDLEKLLEVIVYEQIIEYIEENKILNIYQAGFRKQYSTETALQLVLEDWKRSLKDGDYIIGVFLDLKRAFETIDRERLLMKLKAYGITGVVLEWFKNYLKNRVQKTKINDCVSDSCDINIGVPQGSILGPFLFILYINDLPNILKFCKIQMFADDTLVYVKFQNPLQAVSAMNNELKLVTNWLKVNKLKLNISKTKCLFLGKNFVTENIDIEIDDEKICIVDSFKYLGIILDSQLKFNEYYENLVRKISCKVGYFKRVSGNLSFFSKKIVYNTIIYPNFLYCPSILWDANNHIFERLQVLQNKCMRVILNKDKYTSINFMLKELGWLKVKFLNRYLIFIFIFKIKNNLLPNVMKDFTCQNSSFHDYNTRTRTDFHIFTNKTNLNYKSVFNKGIIEFNNLNAEIKNINNLRTFKKTLKNYLYNKQFEV